MYYVSTADAPLAVLPRMGYKYAGGVLEIKKATYQVIDILIREVHPTGTSDVQRAWTRKRCTLRARVMPKERGQERGVR